MKNGLSIDDILKRVWPVDLNNSKAVAVVSARKVKTKGGSPAIAFTTITRLPKQGTHRHKCYVFAADKNYVGPLSKCPAVKLGCDCITGETKVLTDKGYKTIYELLYSKDKEINYVVNGEVYPSTKPFFKGKKPVWELELDNGNYLSITKEHKVLVYTGTRSYNSDIVTGNGRNCLCYDWVKVKDLKVGDKLVPSVNVNIPYVKRDINYWRDYFTGFFYGDGTCRPWSFTLLSRLENLDTLKKSKFKFTETDCKGRWLLGRRAKEYLLSKGICSERRHIIPDNINIYSFLSGLIDTDGRVHDGAVFIWGTEYLSKLKDILLSMEVQGVKLYKTRSKGEKVNGDFVASKDHYELYISAQGMKQISHNLCSNLYSTFEAQRRMVITPTKIKSIRYAGRQNVYDITVPSVHRFVAEGVIIHNCARYWSTFEVALHLRGASNIIYSNGAYPYVRNPNAKIACCKHLIKALRLVKARGW